MHRASILRAAEPPRAAPPAAARVAPAFRALETAQAEDPQAVLRKVEERGGKVLMPLTEVAPETNIALFADPEGHVVGLM